MIARSSNAEVAVIGAGVIGLAVALELSMRGANVRAFDSGNPGGAASWAGAGMLAPYLEEPPEALAGFLAHSLAMYATYARDVYAASGIDPELQLNGILRVARDEWEMERLRERSTRLAGAGVASTVLDSRATVELEPAIDPHISGGLLVHGEGYLDNRRLGRALRRACERAGVRVAEQTAVTRVEADERRVLGLQTSAGFVAATTVVNAMGAWASQLPGVPDDCVPSVFPVRGQMLALQAPKGLMRHATYTDDVYVVPRRDGRLLIGATTERAGFDARTTAEGIHGLLERGLRVAPALRGFTVSESWAGLRPATDDGLPAIGATTLEGYFLATGHYRNGILLVPATARLLADVIEGKPNAFAGTFALRQEANSLNV